MDQERKTALSITLSSGVRGLIIKAKSSPELEELLKGPVNALEAYGRGWESLGEDPLEIYDMVNGLAGKKTYDIGAAYRVDQIATPLSSTSDGTTVINLSFLRIKGIGGENGVSFRIHGLHDGEEIRKLGQSINRAATAFYRAYVRPIELVMHLEER